MPDRQREAMLYLWERLTSVAGRPVVISRGATSVEVTALKGSVLLKLSDPLGGTRTQRTQDDYVVLASGMGALLDPPQGDLGELGEPEEKDRVYDTQEGKAYECLPPGGEAVRKSAGGEAAWKYTDASHVLVSLHTKEVPL